MAETVLFNKRVPSSFTPSKGIIIPARTVALRFLVTVAGAPTVLQWYLEFSGDNNLWFRETAEEDQGGGVVFMPAVVRTLRAPGGGNLPVGVTALDAQFVRDEQMVRVQLACAGNAVVKLTTPYGEAVVAAT